MKWIVETFPAAQMTGLIIPTRGWVRDGLGLYRNQAEDWWLVHLNTGHGVVRLIGDFLEVVPVADEIAEATNWTFADLDGWRNYDPGLNDKLQAIRDRNPVVMGDATPAKHERTPTLARRIGFDRMGGPDDEAMRNLQ